MPKGADFRHFSAPIEVRRIFREIETRLNLTKLASDLIPGRPDLYCLGPGWRCVETRSLFVGPAGVVPPRGGPRHPGPAGAPWFEIPEPEDSHKEPEAGIFRIPLRIREETGDDLTFTDIRDTEFLYRDGDEIRSTSVIGPGKGAPADAEYLVGALHADLSDERLVTNTAELIWGLGVPGVATLSVGAIAQSKITGLVADLAAKVPTSRLINTTAPITGGGDLSADRTIAMPAATTLVDGYLTAANFVTFNNKVSTTRAINTTAPITGGGDLSADRTIAMAAATAAVDGYLTAANFVTFNAKVSATRAINTTAPLTGGGDLSADRTLAVSNATTGAVGVVQLANHLGGSGTAPTVTGMQETGGPTSLAMAAVAANSALMRKSGTNNIIQGTSNATSSTEGVNIGARKIYSTTNVLTGNSFVVDGYLTVVTGILVGTAGAETNAVFTTIGSFYGLWSTSAYTIFSSGNITIQPSGGTLAVISSNLTMDSTKTVDTVDVSENFSSYVNAAQRKTCRIDAGGTVTVAGTSSSQVTMDFAYASASAYNPIVTLLSHNSTVLPPILWVSRDSSTKFTIFNEGDSDEDVLWTVVGYV